MMLRMCFMAVNVTGKMGMWVLERVHTDHRHLMHCGHQRVRKGLDVNWWGLLMDGYILSESLDIVALMWPLNHWFPLLEGEMVMTSQDGILHTRFVPEGRYGVHQADFVAIEAAGFGTHVTSVCGCR